MKLLDTLAGCKQVQTLWRANWQYLIALCVCYTNYIYAYESLVHMCKEACRDIYCCAYMGEKLGRT